MRRRRRTRWAWEWLSGRMMSKPGRGGRIMGGWRWGPGAVQERTMGWCRTESWSERVICSWRDAFLTHYCPPLSQPPAFFAAAPSRSATRTWMWMGKLGAKDFFSSSFSTTHATSLYCSAYVFAFSQPLNSIGDRTPPPDNMNINIYKKIKNKMGREGLGCAEYFIDIALETGM